MSTILEKVAEKINGSSDVIVNTVVEKLANVEINKRSQAIEAAVSKISQAEKDFKKIDGKNDNISYVDGKRVESMSEKRYNEIAKVAQNIKSLKEALNQALTTNSQESYNKLNGLLGNNKEQASGEAKSES